MLNYFAGDYCLLVRLVLLSFETNLTLKRVFFGESLSEAWGQTPCTARLKKDTYIYIYIHTFIMKCNSHTTQFTPVHSSIGDIAARLLASS